MILVSACLTGEKCRYDAEHRRNPLIAELMKKGKVVAVCPETLGGLGIPRTPCEINRGNAQDVLDGKARVINLAGEDITEFVLAGCYKAVEIAKKNTIRLAVLKDKSVACAMENIHDGNFKGKLIKGKGIFTLLLEKEGIRVINSAHMFSKDDLALKAAKKGLNNRA